MCGNVGCLFVLAGALLLATLFVGLEQSPVEPAPVPLEQPPSSAAAQPALRDWTRYIDESGYSVSVPDGWTIQRAAGSRLLIFRDQAAGLTLEHLPRPAGPFGPPLTDPLAERSLAALLRLRGGRVLETVRRESLLGDHQAMVYSYQLERPDGSRWQHTLTYLWSPELGLMACESGCRSEESATIGPVFQRIASSIAVPGS